MNDYKSAFNAAAADLGAIIALLGFTKYPGVDPVLRAITDLMLEKAENQVLREERNAALANVDALAVQVLKLGGTISFAHHRTDQAGQVPQAWLDVQAERRRQITAEGWTPEHDDEHADGQMAQAAGCYALHAGGIGTDWPDGRQNGAALFWPWDKDSWKPTTPRRDLVKACALALAEIERLDRAAATQGGPRDA
ncbi:hypothetical protein AAA628_01370 [Pseudomonas aeruginosa]